MPKLRRPSDLERARWLVRRRRRPGYRAWTGAEDAQLRALVGHATFPEICARLGRNRNSVCSRLRSLGYSIREDVTRPLGGPATELARQLDIPYAVVWHDVRRGVIPATRAGGKDFFIRRTDARRYARRMCRLQARRERALARIAEPTITKQAFMRRLGLCETQAGRYLTGGIVKAWKIPCRWTEIGRVRWEWLVSRRDAERVKRLRARGRLGLRKKSYRALVAVESARIKRLRRAGRLGRSGRHYRARRPLKPGGYSVKETAALAGVSPALVAVHMREGRLRAAPIRVGGRVFRSITRADARAYAAWIKNRTRHLRWRAIERVHRSGRITLREAAARCGVATGTLAAAIRRGALPARKVAGLRAVQAAEVRRFAAQMRRRHGAA